MSGTRVWNRQFQVASMLFHKKEKILALQGMSHWGAKDFFGVIQNKIDLCKGIILKEDNGYLDPAELPDLDDANFDMYCHQLNKKTDKVSEAISNLLGWKYQWDILKYPGPPRALCADVNWHEAIAFDTYMRVTSRADGRYQKDSLEEATWDILLSSGEQGNILLNEVIYRCFRMLDRQKVVNTKDEMMELFLEWKEGYRFKNPKEASALFHDLVCHFGSDFDDMEPEHKAFLFDKRESRVLKLVAKIERLDYVPEILIIYGAGHFDALKRGIKAAGWKSRGPTTWTSAWTFVPYTTTAMLKALDIVTSV